MEIELIAPASEDSTFLPRMGLGILMARTPADVEVIYSDDVVHPSWVDFYSMSSMWRRWTVRPASSILQSIGYWPINFMQNRLAHVKIAGGKQRHLTGAADVKDDPQTVPFEATGRTPAQVPTPVGFPEMQMPRARLPLVR